MTSILFFSFINIVFSQLPLSLEAENATLLGTAKIASCTNASGEQMVKDINSGPDNALLFQNINIPEAGTYYITLSYFAANDPDITYQLNEQTAETVYATASGQWCYQGGSPADYTFQEVFEAGDNKLKLYDSPIIDKIVISSDTSARPSAAFYINASTGNDDNNGLSSTSPWKSISKVNSLKLIPGDSLFFKTGDTFTGRLQVNNEGGTAGNPILISSYGAGNKPIIDGNGYLSAMHIQNSGYLHISNLEFKNDGGPSQPGESTKLRYGLYVENTYTDGTTFKHFRFENLTFKNIYPTDQISDNDQTGTHAYGFNTSGSWGDEINPFRFEDMYIENCLFTRTGRHALRVLATHNVKIKSNLFEHVGGAGMLIGGNNKNILVEDNTTNYTGSSIDPRMAGRGSGIWCFRSTNLTVQHNRFMHARGIKDSYGMHIDIGNKNVVYQYNYSEDNEGGFVEILGANINVGYRYNLSMGDGWRSRGGQKGKVFWISGWSGNPTNPVGSDSVFIYNNSVFVRDSIAPDIQIVEVTQNTRIYNNIIYIANTFGEVQIYNPPFMNDFDHNIWHGNIPNEDTEGESYRGTNAFTSDPLYMSETVTNESGFVLQEGSPAIGSGKLIYNAGISHPYDYFHNNWGRDYFGNPVSSTEPPNIGAVNGGIVNSNSEAIEPIFKIYPNPVRVGESILIEIPAIVNTQSLSIQLMTIDGKILFEKRYKQQHEIHLGTENLPQGYYQISLKSGNYQMTKQVVVF
ncbi:MAG: T9SS type A sorting domain-containing protein [Desulfobulbaceae bacterium]|nr:T9SS type A sorting domain-containing protein [Desulfobulbaceae bacterium]